MDAESQARELERAEALIAPEWSGLELHRRPPQPRPDDIGAVTGFGLGSTDGSLQASIYLFEAWGGGGEAAQMLQEMVDGDGYRAVTAVNGALMLLAVADEDNAGAVAALDQLAGAFSGLE